MWTAIHVNFQAAGCKVACEGVLKFVCNKGFDHSGHLMIRGVPKILGRNIAALMHSHLHGLSQLLLGKARVRLVLA
jgi:hypothetical protein